MLIGQSAQGRLAYYREYPSLLFYTILFTTNQLSSRLGSYSAAFFLFGAHYNNSVIFGISITGRQGNKLLSVLRNNAGIIERPFLYFRNLIPVLLLILRIAEFVPVIRLFYANDCKDIVTLQAVFRFKLNVWMFPAEIFFPILCHI